MELFIIFVLLAFFLGGWLRYKELMTQRFLFIFGLSVLLTAGYFFFSKI